MKVSQLLNQAIAHHQARRYPEAEAIYRQILVAWPNHPQAIHMLGLLAYNVNRYELAEQLMRQVLVIDPRHAACYGNLGLVLVAQGRPEEAIGAYRKALEIQPAYPEALNSLGNALQRRGELKEAEECFRKALELRPNLATTHWNLGNLLLLRGDFEQGWKEYAWRTRVPDFDFVRKDFAQPQWDGRELNGRLILINTEQGFGDNIQFVRYLPQVRERGGKIIFGCVPELIQLFRGQFKIDQWVTPSQKLPDFHVHCPIASLPMLLGTTLQTIPAKVPYFCCDAVVRQFWADRLSALRGLKVGVAWAGRPAHPNDHNRSITLAMLSKLFYMQGVTLVSLQKGEASRQARAQVNIMNWTEELVDFAETASLICGLDLVITVDTAVAHLAGALGKPVWVLLPFVPDWRWMLDRDDSPWYPTMRLFRQTKLGDWSDPIERVSQSLERLARGETLQELSPENRGAEGHG